MGQIEQAMLAAVESASLTELAARVLPRLQQAARASATLLYRYDSDGRPQPLGGDISEIIPHYSRHYYQQDPVHGVPRTLAPQPRVVLATRRVDARAYRKSAAYGEFYSPFDLEHLACVWLTHLPYGSPGMTGVLFTRPKRGRDFDGADERLLRRVLPVLSAAVLRAERLQELDLQRQALEAMIDASSGAARAVLSPTGQTIWASERLRTVPDGVRGAARRLGDAALGKSPLARAPLSVEGAQLSILRSASGAPLVLVEMEAPARDGDELARRFQLTRAEGAVLAQLGGGLSNAAIAARLHVSVETVRTHVRRILAKLGVRSRVEAALRV
jgi:DNA-binding CsgD family transcriptional regulator